MRFYYFSIISWVIFFAASVLASGVLWLLWAKVFKLKLVNPLLWCLTGVLFLLPWSEEISIAYNFDQQCKKDAGEFVYRTMEVEGFFDGTGGWDEKRLLASGYKFVESRDRSGIWRHERNGNDVRSAKIDAASARYHYKLTANHSSISHKINKWEIAVIDSQSGETLGRITDYSRAAYSLFISIASPDMTCREANGPQANFFKRVLIPTAR